MKDEFPPVTHTSFLGHSGVEIFMAGRPLSEGPLPALFYFALSGDESLGTSPFNQPVAIACQAPLRVFSLTLPCHGEGFDRNRSVDLWAETLREGHDVLTDFFAMAKHQVDHLIKEEIVDRSHIAVAGLSRGGFIAAHLAARHPDIKTILAFAPLTDLAARNTFADLVDDPLFDTLKLEHQYNKLANKDIRFYIGNRDVCVSTDACFQCVRGITESAYKKGIRSPHVELIVSPSIGHQGHGTPPHIFRAGAEWIQDKLKVKP